MQIQLQLLLNKLNSHQAGTPEYQSLQNQILEIQKIVQGQIDMPTITNPVNAMASAANNAVGSALNTPPTTATTASVEQSATRVVS